MVFQVTSGDGGFLGTFFPPGSIPIPRPLVPTKPPHRERMRVLQELISSSHKVPSMNRLGVAGAMAQAVADNPLASVEGESSEGKGKKLVWKKSNNGMEQQVVKLMEEFVVAAMQFLQSKALCMIPIFLATMIYQSRHQNEIPEVKLEPNAPS